MQNEMRITVL